MASEALLIRDCDAATPLAAVATVASGEVYQGPDGRAGVRQGSTSAASGDAISIDQGEDVYDFLKTALIVFCNGDEVYWDHSANTATYAPASDRDFYLGVCVKDAAASATRVRVKLNKRPNYNIDLNRGGLADEFLTVIVKTVVGSTTVEVPHIERYGGSHALIFGATAEAQKLDLLSQQGFAVASNWIAEIGINIIDDGDAAAIDFNVGVASATNATDADLIAESCFFHMDGNTTTILAESDDGTTEVAATTTTLSYTLGTPVHLKLDGRDPSNVKYYINGVEVNAATTNLGNIALAAGPLKLLAHLEKSSDDTTADFRILYARVRTMQLDVGG